MTTFNRIVTTLLWITLLIVFGLLAAAPIQSMEFAQSLLAYAADMLREQQAEHPTNFLIAQIAVGIGSVLVFGLLITLEILTGQSRGVRIRTAQGGSAELDTASIGRRLNWHLDQLAEIISVVPAVKSKGGSVDIRLEIEAAPDIDVPMKTDEVVEATREIIEEDMGLKLGKLDVRMRYAPFDPDWVR